MGPDDKSNLVLVFGTMSELKVNMNESPLDLRELLELLLKSLSDVVSDTVHPVNSVGRIGSGTCETLVMASK